MSSLLDVVCRLSSCEQLAATSVEAAYSILSPPPTATSLLKELRELAVNLRRSGRYGRLRIVVLIGLTLGGEKGLTELERCGILLAPPDTIVKFSIFLKQLRQDAEREVRWSALEARIETYEAYLRLVQKSQPSTAFIQRVSRRPLRLWVKQLLCLVEMFFLQNYFGAELQPDVETIFGAFSSAEEFAYAVSCAVAMANQMKQLNAMDLGSPALGDVYSEEIKEILEAAHLLNTIKEAARYVCSFTYSLRWEEGTLGPVAILAPPSPDFERSIQMGFIRGEIGKGKVFHDMWESGAATRPTLLHFADYFVRRLGDRLFHVADPNTTFRRVRVEMPMIPSLPGFLNEGMFADEEAEIRGLIQDFMMPLEKAGGLPPRLTDNLDYGGLRKMFKLLRFFCMVDGMACRPYAKRDFTTFKNSLVRIIKESALRGLLELTGEGPLAIDDFIRFIAADASSLGHYDLQYSPLLRLRSISIPQLPNPETEYVLLPSVLVASNGTRNSQIRSGTRFHRDGHAFVAFVSEELRTHFSDLVTEKRLKLDELKTEVDIAMLCGGQLYLIECKHSLTATDPHEMRDLWRDITKGVGQITRAKTILADESRRLTYLKAWFPKLSADEILNMPIIGSVLSSHRLFSGLHINGIAIRDFASLSRLIEDGVVGMGFNQADGSILMSRFRVRETERLSCVDIENYFSPQSRFHQMYFHSMKAQHVFQRIGELTLVKESFAFEVDLDGWKDYMAQQGHTRLPDQKVSIPEETEFDAMLASLQTESDREL